MNALHLQFLLSTINNLVESAESGVSIVAKSKDGDEYCSVVINLENPLAELSRDGNKSVIHTQREDALAQTIEQYSTKGGEFLIRHGTIVTRIGLRGNSVFRETVQPEEYAVKHPQWAVGKSTHLDLNQSSQLLKSIGLMTPDGEIKAPMRKKFKQVNHFLELLVPVLKDSDRQEYAIVDCGCGKSYLGFVLYWYLRNVLKKKGRFTGIDVSERVIQSCRERAKTLALPGMEFQCSSILGGELPNGIDLLISLHACDTATDEALACGVAGKAKNIVVVPCCQHELANQMNEIPFYPIKKHGIFKHRFCDLLTDMMRALFLEAHGYTVTAGEFVSVEESPKNLMLRAKRGNAQSAERQREYEAFKRNYNLSPSIDRMLSIAESGTIGSFGV